MHRGGYVYILTNAQRTVLYTGATSDLELRISQHRHGVFGGFSKRYRLNRLVYYADFGGIEEAIQEEKRIKAGSRADKEALIEKHNPGWGDLAEHW